MKVILPFSMGLVLLFLGYFIVRDLKLFPGYEQFEVSELSDCTGIPPIIGDLGVTGPLKVSVTERYRFAYYLIECKIDSSILMKSFDYISYDIESEEKISYLLKPFREVGYDYVINIDYPAKFFEIELSENGLTVSVVLDPSDSALIRVIDFKDKSKRAKGVVR